eukprot:comp17109_c0_seq1/m.15878 comp17109_c0_seq1/g.15878  ORF comp17109_c0_seq1/g.15878 comp17109_c0_seq1/m.15878 type:complete len:340 (-) comp17109_c0_seq1:627-1646(-)
MVPHIMSDRRDSWQGRAAGQPKCSTKGSTWQPVDGVLPCTVVPCPEVSNGNFPIALARVKWVWDKKKQLLWRLWLGYSTLLLALLVLYTEVWVNDYIYRIVISMFVGGLGISTAYVLQRALKPRNSVVIPLTATLITIVVLYNVLSSMSCWCCKSDEDFEAMCSIAAHVKQIFEENGIKYWVCWGSLLGAHREADLPFQSMPWEHDFDVCVMEEDWPLIVDLLAEVPGLRQKNTMVDDGRLRSLVSRTYVDFYRYHYKANGTQMATRDGATREVVTPTELIEPMTTIRACNQQWPAPGRVVEAIIDAYGPDFRTPHWPPGLTGVMCKLRTDCPLSVRPT